VFSCEVGHQWRWSSTREPCCRRLTIVRSWVDSPLCSFRLMASMPTVSSTITRVQKEETAVELELNSKSYRPNSPNFKNHGVNRKPSPPIWIHLKQRSWRWIALTTSLVVSKSSLTSVTSKSKVFHLIRWWQYWRTTPYRTTWSKVGQRRRRTHTRLVIIQMAIQPRQSLLLIIEVSKVRSSRIVVQVRKRLSPQPKCTPKAFKRQKDLQIQLVEEVSK